MTQLTTTGQLTQDGKDTLESMNTQVEYTIVIYRNGRALTSRYATLGNAKAAAEAIFAKTGVIVGIEANLAR